MGLNPYPVVFKKLMVVGRPVSMVTSRFIELKAAIGARSSAINRLRKTHGSHPPSGSGVIEPAANLPHGEIGLMCDAF